MIPNSTIIAACSIPESLFSKQSAKGVVEKEIGSDKVVIKVGNESVTVKVPEDSLQKGDSVRLRFQKDYIIIDKIPTQNQSSRQGGDSFTPQTIQTGKGLGPVLDSFISQLQSSPEQQGRVNSENGNPPATSQQANITDTENSGHLSQKISSVLNLIENESSEVDPAITAKIKVLARDLSRNGNPADLQAVKQELLHLLKTVKQDLTTGTPAQKLPFIEIAEKQIPDGVYKFSNVSEALNFLKQNNDKSIESYLQDITKGKELYLRTFTSGQGTVAMVLDQNDLSKEIQALSKSFSSRVLQSVPSEVFEQIISDRGKLDLQSLYTVDSTLSSAKYTLPQTRAGSQTAQSAALTQWLNIALDNSETLPEVASRPPGNASTLARVLEELSAKVPIADLPPASQMGVTQESIENTPRRADAFTKLLENLGFNFEHKMGSSAEPQNAASNLKSALLTALAYFGSENAKSEKSETTQKDGTTGKDIKPGTESDVNSYRSTKARSDTRSSDAESPANTGKQYKPGDNQPDTNVKIRPEALSSKNQPAPTEPPVSNQNKSQSQPSIQPRADQAITDAKTKPDAATLRVNSQTPPQESTQSSDTEIRQQNGLKVNQQVNDSGNKSEQVNLKTTAPVSSEPAKASGTDTETRQQIQLKADQNISDTKSNTESANSKIKIPVSVERTDAQIKETDAQTAANKQDGAKPGESIAALKARIESSNKATISPSPKSPAIPDSEYENTEITNKPVSAKTGENIAILKARLASLSTKGNIPVSPELQSSTPEKNTEGPDNAKQASQSRPYGNVAYLKARPDAPGNKPDIPSPSEPEDTVGQEKIKQQAGAKPNENIAYLKTKLAALDTGARTEITRISVNSPASNVSEARTDTQNPEPENASNGDKKTIPETDPNSANIKENQKTPDTKANPTVPVSPNSNTPIKNPEPENAANVDKKTIPETDPNSVNVKENQKTPDTKANPTVPVSPDSNTPIKNPEPENAANVDKKTIPETDPNSVNVKENQKTPDTKANPTVPVSPDSNTPNKNPEPENAANVDKKTIPETDPNSVNVRENQKTPDTKANPPVPVSPDSSTPIKNTEPENAANTDQKVIPKTDPDNINTRGDIKSPDQKTVNSDTEIKEARIDLKKAEADISEDVKIKTNPEADESIKNLKNKLESLSKELLSQLQFTTKGTSPSEIEKDISRVKNSIPVIPHRVVELINDTLKEIRNAIEKSQPSPLTDKRPYLAEESSSILKAIASSKGSDFKQVIEQILTKIDVSGPIERDALPRIERLLFDLRQFIVKSLPEPMMMISELLGKAEALIKSSGDNASPLMMFALNTAAETSRDFIADIFNEISVNLNINKSLPFADGPGNSSVNGPSPEAVDISSDEMSFSPPEKFLFSDSALDVTKSLQEMTREIKMSLTSIPPPVSERGPEFSSQLFPAFSRHQSPASLPEALSSFTSKVQGMIQKTLQELSSLADLSTEKSRPAQSATGPLRALSAGETTETFDSVKKQPDKNTSAALDNFSNASIKTIEKLSMGLKQEVERVASESAEKEIAGFRFEGKSDQSKTQLPVQKAMSIIEKAVNEIIGKLSHLQETIRELPEKAQHSERGNRKELVDLSRENRAPGPEKETGRETELSSGMRQMVRQSVDSLLNRLESLQLLARQVHTSSGEQQILALPMKIGGEWTEVNIRFLKKRQAEKTTQKQNHFSVYLNVAPSILGAISVNMEYERKKELRLQIEFEKKDTKAWFSRNSDSLRQALRGLDLPLTQFEIRPAKNKSEPDNTPENSESAIDLKV